MPVVSIITINLNNANGLEKTILSVVAQTFSDYELIVIDGNSIDYSREVIERHTTKISKWVSEKDNGIYNAQNKGIDLAMGEYCLFINSGDYLVDKNVLQKFIYAKSQADIITGDMLIADSNGNLSYANSPDKITIRKMLTDTIWHPVSFIKTELFKKFGKYNENFKIAGDYEFFVRILIKEKSSYTHLNFPVSVFSLDGLSSNAKSKTILNEERREIHNKYFNPLIVKAYRFYSKLMKWSA
jgi:glycosyltransferase involved in cell wall biosynthesis